MIVIAACPSSLAAERAVARASTPSAGSGAPIIDLTESNPTRVGLSLSGRPARAARRSARRSTTIRSRSASGPARAAVAADFRRRGIVISADRVALTVEHQRGLRAAVQAAVRCRRRGAGAAAQLSAVRAPDAARIRHGACRTTLEYHGVVAHRPRLDQRAPRPLACKRAPDRVAEQPDRIVPASRRPGRARRALRRARGWAIIGDEVFADYPLDPAPARRRTCWPAATCSTFSLGGLSKSAGLPQVKLGWIGFGGPAAKVDEALAAYEIVADTYLSVSTPVQVAAPALIEQRRGDSRADPGARRGATWRRCASRPRAHPSVDVLPVEGGWSAVCRCRAVRSEEALVARAARAGRCARASGILLRFRARGVRRGEPAGRAARVRSPRSRACWRAPRGSRRVMRRQSGISVPLFSLASRAELGHRRVRRPARCSARWAAEAGQSLRADPADQRDAAESSARRTRR